MRVLSQLESKKTKNSVEYPETRKQAGGGLNIICPIIS